MDQRQSRFAHIPSFIRNRDGNFGIMTCLLLPVLLGAGGLAMDVSDMLLARSEMQDATDMAALATATALANGQDAATAQDAGKAAVAEQMASYLGGDAPTRTAIKNSTVVSVTTTGDSTSGKTYNVAVTTSYDLGLTPLSAALGHETANISSSSSTVSHSPGAGGDGDGLSMELVLDRSGSMWQLLPPATCTPQDKTPCTGTSTTPVKRMDALKAAASTLFDSLDQMDPKKTIVRTGAISYNSAMTGQSPMDWGTAGARTFVQALVTGGQTDATVALTTADANIKKVGTTDIESQRHAEKGETNIKRYIVLMTDGLMTGTSLDWNQTIDTAVRNACDKAKGDGITLFTVGFMVTDDKGISLLKHCATSEADFYSADSLPSLVSAFSSIGKNTVAGATLVTK